MKSSNGFLESRALMEVPTIATRQCKR